MKIRFWGTRGSIPVSGEQFFKYGGDTICVELPEYGIIIDAGSGIRPLGLCMMREQREKLPLHIFFSHYHWDHIQGFPFFLPVYTEEQIIHLYGQSDVEEMVADQMRSPYFPIPYQALRSEIVPHHIDLRDEIRIGSKMKVTFYPTRHPQETLAMRFDAEGKTFVFASDNEYDEVYRKELGKGFRKFCSDVDLLLVDCQYTDQEYPEKVGWGHSCVSQVIQMAHDVKPKKLLLSHHDPTHSDDTIQMMESKVRAEYESAFACCEGMEIEL